MNQPLLRPVDRVQILTLVDNVTDLQLASEERVQRLGRADDTLAAEPLRAEPGYAALVRVTRGETTHSFLFDTGLSENGLIHNMDLLGVEQEELETIVLSHGHADHTRGLGAVLKRMGGRSIRLHLHPDAFLDRRVDLPNGKKVVLPAPDRAALVDAGVKVVEERGVSTLFDDMVLITGEIPRHTEFEQGFPPHQSRIDGEWQPDAKVADDQALVMQLRDKGLIVLTGCGHSGIINTLDYAQQLGNGAPIHAVLGGFHLGGRLFEKIIEPTVAALRDRAPETIVPGHCTGWKAVHAIAEALPDAFLPNSVGSCFTFN